MYIVHLAVPVWCYQPIEICVCGLSHSTINSRYEASGCTFIFAISAECLHATSTLSMHCNIYLMFMCPQLRYRRLLWISGQSRAVLLKLNSVDNHHLQGLCIYESTYWALEQLSVWDSDTLGVWVASYDETIKQSKDRNLPLARSYFITFESQLKVSCCLVKLWDC